MNNIVKDLEEKFERAYKLASEYGEVIGWVSRTSPSSISEEGGLVVFDVEPAIYFKDFIEIASAGSYLAVVDIKTCHVISLNIISVERRDLLAELDLSDMYLSIPNREVSGLLTRTRIRAKPLLAYDPLSDNVFIANYVIEPQSPVIKLRNRRIINKVLGLPDKGVFIGYVTTGDKPAFDSQAVLYLPLKTFYQHVLVLGTTGSGKTTLLKNMLSSMNNYLNNDRRVTLLIMDPNKDYITLFLKPTWDFSSLDADLEKKMIENINNSVSKPSGLTIILPLTKYSISSIIRGESNWAKVLKLVAEDYIKTTYYPIAERHNWSIEITNMRVAEEPYKPPLRYVEVSLEINYGNSVETNTLYIIPYSFRFVDFTPREFISLNPYFTRQAKDSLSRLLNYLKSMNVRLDTIDDFYEILREARYRVYEKPEKTPYSRPVLDPNKEYVIDLIKDLAIHKSTIENIIRQIGSLLDIGLFDIGINGKSSDKYLQEPPMDMIMENHLKLFNGYPIVVDLEYLQEHSLADPEKVISIVAFRVLNRVFEWKLTRTRQRVVTQPVIIIFDEAHRFFPSKGGGKEEYIEHVSSMIDRIARLGRARRLGLIFSTHSPKDVHDIILQLTNTKIILRMDKTQLINLDIPSEYRELVTRASDRVGIIKSPVLRSSYITFRTPLPLVGHYDLSIID